MQKLSGFSKQAITGTVPDRMYNGLPVNAAINLPTSTLGRPMSGVPETPIGKDDLSYSPGIVETSGALSQVQVFNPPSNSTLPNSMTASTRAAGNILLQTVRSIF